jgi:hypothetical protein
LVFGCLGHGFGVVANRGDRFDELSGNLFDRTFKLRGEIGHLVASFLRSLLLGLAAGELPRLDLERIVPENLDGLDHALNFVAAIGVIEADGGVAGRESLHGALVFEVIGLTIHRATKATWQRR